MKVTLVDKNITEIPPVEEAPPIIDRVLDDEVIDGVPFFSAKTRYVPPIKPSIDRSWAGQVLTFTVRNTTSAVWEKCYPGAFWVRWGERIPGPASKDQCLGNIGPGATVHFRIVVPLFPTDEKPDALRIAVLEDGVRWHTVEDVRVR